MQILLLDGAYKLELKMLGKALDIGEKTFDKRGPEILPENFESELKQIDEVIFHPGIKK